MSGNGALKHRRDVNSATPNRSWLCCICWNLNEIFVVDVSVTTTVVRHLAREHLMNADRKSVDEVPPTLEQRQTAVKSSPLSTDNQLNLNSFKQAHLISFASHSSRRLVELSHPVIFTYLQGFQERKEVNKEGLRLVRSKIHINFELRTSPSSSIMFCR